MRRLALALIVVAALVAWPHAQTKPQPQQTFRTGTDVVLVDVSVRKDNKPVPGLTVADFELKDNGVRQEIESLETTSVPIDLSIVVDVSGNPARPWTTPKLRSAVAAEVDAEVRRLTKLLRPGDRVRLFAVDTYVQQIWPLQPAETTPQVREIAFNGQASLYDTLATVVLQPVEPTRRHVVVASTVGRDTISAISAGGFRTIAGRADAQLHVVMRERDADTESKLGGAQCMGSGAISRGADAGMVSQGTGMGLCGPTYRFWLPTHRRLFPACGGGACQNRLLSADGAEVKLGADSTGGGLYQTQAITEPTLFSTFAAAFEHFRQSYVLRYTARGVRREGWHQISVTVPRDSSLRISARTGYAVDLPPTPTPMPAPRPAAVVAGGMRTLNDVTAAYGRGEYDAVNLGLRRFADPVKLIGDFDRGGNPFPSNPRREAMLALELAEAGMFSAREDAREDAARLLQRFSRLIRDPIEPDAFERAWLIGVIGMLQGTMRPATTSGFVDWALSRFPEEPRLILARAIVLDQQTVASAGGRPRSAQSPEHAEAIAAAYQEAAKHPSVRADALVRWAWLLHRNGKTDEALAKLTEAATAGQADQALTYLRELLTARVLLAKDRGAEAVAAFRRAIAIAPGASSAKVGLMSALTILGERDEAEKLAETLQTTKATVVDPWWIYWQGDYRRYPETLKTLREMAR